MTRRDALNEALWAAALSLSVSARVIYGKVSDTLTRRFHVER